MASTKAGTEEKTRPIAESADDAVVVVEEEEGRAFVVMATGVAKKASTAAAVWHPARTHVLS